MKLPRLLLLSVAAFTAAAAAHSQDLSRCRALPDAAARLACYDNLPLPAAALAAPAAPAAPPVRPAGAAVVPAAGAAAVPGPSVAAAPATVLAGEAAFGLQGPARGELAAVRSSVAGRFEGWGTRSRIRLVNGQVWEVSDDSNAVTWLFNPQVTVRRALLGSFVLEVESLNRTARVRRVE